MRGSAPVLSASALSFCRPYIRCKLIWLFHAVFVSVQNRQPKPLEFPVCTSATCFYGFSLMPAVRMRIRRIWRQTVWSYMPKRAGTTPGGSKLLNHPPLWCGPSAPFFCLSMRSAGHASEERHAGGHIPRIASISRCTNTYRRRNAIRQSAAIRRLITCRFRGVNRYRRCSL